MCLTHGLLDGVRLVSVGEPFDGGDLGSFGLNCEHEAGPSRLAVEEDRAGATYAVLASEVGATESKVVADGVGESAPGFNSELDSSTVDRERDWDGRHVRPPM
jgi:hypothetical protein